MVKLRAAGNIFKEVSQNIPSSEFALKELIKNSYEANSSIFEFDLSDDRIVISDDGTGMTDKDIVSLLTLSESNKKFGTKVHNRYISGQKGIGFFSVFKFGNKVTVVTSDASKHQIHTFNLDLNEITKNTNISNIEVPIHNKTNSKFQGTKIVIEDLNTETIKIFKNLMKDPGESSRLTNSILDPDFKIRIKINNNLVVNDVEPSKDFQSAKIADFQYASDKNRFKFTINYNGKRKQCDVPNRFWDLLETKGFSIRLNINVYSFKRTRVNTLSAPKIFYYSQPKGKLSPLIYINNSIFIDNEIYNVEINTSSKSKEVFRQQTGIVSIYLDNENILKFNTDRTQINESQTYEDLKLFTTYFSKESQKTLRNLMDNEKKKDVIRHSSNKSSEYISSKDTDSKSSKKEIETKKLKNCSHVLMDKLQTGHTYKFDDLFVLYDAKGDQQVAPINNPFGSSEDVIFDKKKYTFTFTNCGEFPLNLRYLDKKTNKECSLQGKMIVLNPYKKEKGTYDFIYSLVKESDKIDFVISEFRTQLNELYKLKKYNAVFVSSLRTFLELVVRNIAVILQYDKIYEDDISLKDLLNKVLSEKEVNSNFLKKLSPYRQKSGLKTIYKKISQKENSSKNASVVEVLNMFTHSGMKLLTIDDAKDEQKCIVFLFTYLNFLLNNPTYDNNFN